MGGAKIKPARGLLFFLALHALPPLAQRPANDVHLDRDFPHVGHTLLARALPLVVETRAGPVAGLDEKAHHLDRTGQVRKPPVVEPHVTRTAQHHAQLDAPPQLPALLGMRAERLVGADGGPDDARDVPMVLVVRQVRETRVAQGEARHYQLRPTKVCGTGGV